MDEITKKARELGYVLLASEECKKMRETELAVANDEESEKALNDYLDCRSKIEQTLANENPDSEVLKAMSLKMDACQERVQKLPLIVEMSNAQKEFSRRIEEVNAILRYIVTGEDGSDMESGEGCGGLCAQCPGCH